MVLVLDLVFLADIPILRLRLRLPRRRMAPEVGSETTAAIKKEKTSRSFIVEDRVYRMLRRRTSEGYWVCESSKLSKIVSFLWRGCDRMTVVVMTMNSIGHSVSQDCASFGPINYDFTMERGVFLIVFVLLSSATDAPVMTMDSIGHSFFYFHRTVAPRSGLSTLLCCFNWLRFSYECDGC